MTGSRAGKVGYLSIDPHILKHAVAFQSLPGMRGELRNGVNCRHFESLCAGQVLACTSVHPYHFALANEERHLNHETGLQGRRF